MQSVIEELVKRIKEICESEKVFVVYHFDIDGCASASLLWRIFQKNNVQADFCPATRGYERMTMEKITQSNPDRIVLVDYVPGPEFVSFLKGYNTSILDHHTHEEFLEDFDYFTAADMGVNTAISYLISLAAKELKIKDIDWIGKLGAFWDKTVEDTDFFYEDIYEKELESMMPFNLVVSLTQIRGSEKMFELFNSSSNFDEASEKVKDLDDYKRAKELFDRELKGIEFTRKAYPKDKLDIYWIKTNFKHIRVYVDYITFRNKGTKVFLLDEISRFKFSLRTSFDINLVEIIKKLSEKNKNFGGGGHPKACGAMLKDTNVEELLIDFIELYKKEMSK